MDKNKVVAWLSIGLLFAWVLAAINALLPSVALNGLAALAPLLPVGLRLAQAGWPQGAGPKGGEPEPMLLVHTGAMVASVSSYILSGRLAELGVSSALVLLVSLLAVPVFIGWLTTEVWTLRQQDELHRRIALDTAAVAYGLALVMAFSVEMAQRSGYLLDWQISDLLWPWLAIAWLPAWLAARWRYA